MAATYATTRHSLHGLAELVLAGPRYTAGGSMRLRAGSDGIRTWDDPPVRLSQGELVVGAHRISVSGLTFGDAAAAVGLTAQPLDHAYHDGPHRAARYAGRLRRARPGRGRRPGGRTRPRGRGAARVLADDRADPVARALRRRHHPGRRQLRRQSRGDGYHDLPYAYVGPHQVPTGSFWNALFGASRPITDLPDVAAVATFFDEGARETSR